MHAATRRRPTASASASVRPVRLCTVARASSDRRSSASARSPNVDVDVIRMGKKREKEEEEEEEFDDGHGRRTLALRRTYRSFARAGRVESLRACMTPENQILTLPPSL